MLAAGVGRYLF